MFWSSEKETNKRQIHTARTLVESGNGFKILHISLYFPISDSLPFFHLFHFRFACSSDWVSPPFSSHCHLHTVELQSLRRRQELSNTHRARNTTRPHQSDGSINGLWAADSHNTDPERRKNDTWVGGDGEGQRVEEW